MRWFEVRTRFWIRRLQRHARRWWYAPLISFLAFIDHFVVFIPTDGLLVSAVMLHPRRWIYTFLCLSVGSSLGALVLAALIEWHGLPLLLQISPGLDQTGMWSWTEAFMNQHGIWALFLVAVSPVVQHPAIALAALAKVPLLNIFLVVLAGRLIKYAVISWVASHAPHLVRRLWGVSREVKEVEEAAGLLPSASASENSTSLQSQGEPKRREIL